VTLGPVVSGAGLSEDEVIRAENLTVGSRSDAVHGPWLQIHEHRPRDESPATRLIVVHVHSLQLQLVVPLVPPRGINPVLRAHHLPELRSDLVPALPSLDVKNLTHLRWKTRVPENTNEEKERSEAQKVKWTLSLVCDEEEDEEPFIGRIPDAVKWAWAVNGRFDEAVGFKGEFKIWKANWNFWIIWRKVSPRSDLFVLYIYHRMMDFDSFRSGHVANFDSVMLLTAVNAWRSVPALTRFGSRQWGFKRESDALCWRVTSRAVCMWDQVGYRFGFFGFGPELHVIAACFMWIALLSSYSV